jgi:hypothetical protein
MSWLPCSNRAETCAPGLQHSPERQSPRSVIPGTKPNKGVAQTTKNPSTTFNAHDASYRVFARRIHWYINAHSAAHAWIRCTDDTTTRGTRRHYIRHVVASPPGEQRRLRGRLSPRLPNGRQAQTRAIAHPGASLRVQDAEEPEIQLPAQWGDVRSAVRRLVLPDSRSRRPETLPSLFRLPGDQMPRTGGAHQQRDGQTILREAFQR